MTTPAPDARPTPTRPEPSAATPAPGTPARATDPERDLAECLELTAGAWRDAIDALVFDDCDAARRVLAGARDRRAAAVRARVGAQSHLSQARVVLTAHRLVRAVNTVQLVADVERLEQLVVATARRVLSGRGHVAQHLRPEVATLGRAGAQRLHDLAMGRRHGFHDADYLACGEELHEVSTCLARHARASRRGDEATRLCVALTSCVLEASRHASRAA